MSDEKKGMDLEGVQVGERKKIKIEMPKLPKALTLEEKRYLLAVERGDTPNVRRILQKAYHKKHIDSNCMDSLGRGALLMAIDNENLEMLELLVVMGVNTRDSLLHAINVEFVEAVELLLQHEELIHKEGEPHSWETVDPTTATFAPDITPLTLAAHRDNFEIIKILLDRGATLPMPHDIKCGCDECITATREDSLRHSLARVNAYRALASPSLIALSSNDPIQTAFELSWELRNLAFTEQECKSEYLELRRQCQQFAVDLLSHTRGSKELAIVLNHDPNAPPYEDGEHMKLARLEMAINYKQKKFVAHPNIQQLLAAIWYEGVPGFRRLQASQKLMEIVKVAALFPFYCMLYMFAPNCKTGKLMRKPFMKFLIHASSYLFFLLLLILVSQRAEVIVVQMFGTKYMKEVLREQLKQQRGNGPTFLEMSVVFYVLGFIYEETIEIVREGIGSYLRNMWNIIDFTRNSLYVAVMMLRSVAYLQQRSEISSDPALAFVPREQWDDFDPQLIAEGLFAAANVFSALKLVHLFSINPHLGPLQISLGRMVIDIVKFFFIYSLVLFAFACGLNQLLWYFAELERLKCYHLPGEMPDWANNGDACMKWRRFGNLFESSQSLFWASFGMVGLDAFELTGIKSYTRFWGLLMFGSYSVINVIVLLNLLIAMMSNSYAAIVEHSDVEWKFARTRLWMSYFEESATLPPPFNIIPAPKHILKVIGVREKDKIRRMSTKRQERVEKERDYRYTAVMRALVWRYVAAMHRKFEENPVTEDDINEIKSEITAMRCDIIDVLGKNGMDISSTDTKDKAVVGKKMRVWERRLMKDFHVAPVAGEETVEELKAAVDPPENEDSLAKFRRLAKLAVLQSSSHKWGEVVREACKSSQIGRSCNRESFRNQQYLQRAMDEARKLQNMKPMRGHSPTPSPIPITDPTRDGILHLIKEIREETGTTVGSRPPSSSNLLGVTPIPSRSVSPAVPSLAAAVSQKRAEVTKETAVKSAAPSAPKQDTAGKPQEFVSRYYGGERRGSNHQQRPTSPQYRAGHPEVRVHCSLSYMQHQAPQMPSQGANKIDISPSRSRHENCLVTQADKTNNDCGHVVKQAEKRAPPKPQKEEVLVLHPEHKYYVERGVKHDIPHNLKSEMPSEKSGEPVPLSARHDQAAKVVKRKPPQTPGSEQPAQQTTVHQNSQSTKQESIAIPRPRPDNKSEVAPSMPAPESRQQSKSTEPSRPLAPKPIDKKPAPAPEVKPSEAKPIKPADPKPAEVKPVKPKTEMALPTVEVTASTPLPSNKFSSTEKLIPASDPPSPDMSHLGAGQKVDGVSTIKRQPKTGWL